MRIKELSIVFALAIFGAIIIISVQENNPLTVKDMKTFENYQSVSNIDELGLKIVADCWKQSSNLSDNKICFNEKINQLESKFPSIKSELRELGFVIEELS